MSKVFKGIDVSKWQGSIDWIKVKNAGIQFAILRAGFGRYDKQKDPTFERNYKEAMSAGIAIGAYHYSYAATVAMAKQEAGVFLSWLEGKRFEYPVCFDLEDSSLKTLGRQRLTEIADTFLSYVESKGYYVCLYSNKNWLKYYLDSDYLLNKYDLWLAFWTKSNKPDVDHPGRCGIWQYTSRGSVDGIKGNVDLDIAYKDYPAIIMGKGLNGFLGHMDTSLATGLKAGSQYTRTHRIHTVVKGDTLWDIARKYIGSGLKYKDIMKLNGLSSTIIYPGQRLKIPG